MPSVLVLVNNKNYHMMMILAPYNIIYIHWFKCHMVVMFVYLLSCIPIHGFPDLHKQTFTLSVITSYYLHYIKCLLGNHNNVMAS